MTIVSAALLIFLVLDPIGNLPLFIPILDRVPAARRRRVLARELLVALLFLLLFLAFGARLLALLEIERSSLGIAGGIVLFLIAIRMIFPGHPGGLFGDLPEGEPLVFPLAVPLIAGPGALTTVLLIASRHPGRMLDWFAAVVLAWLASSLLLLFAAPLSRWLGARGINAMERLMGLILTLAAVQMCMSGIRRFLAME